MSNKFEKYSPRYPQDIKPLGYINRPTCYPAVSGGEGVIRLSLGKLLVNLLQVVKRTNTTHYQQYLNKHQ